MKKDERYFKGKVRALAVPFVPLALSAMLVACNNDYEPAEPYEAPPLTDVERDTSGGSYVEHLDRGLVVVPAEDGGNAISWRWTGLDEQRIIFGVYKNDEFFRTVRPGEPTFLVDANGMPGDTYQVEALVDDDRKDVSDVVEAPETPYLSIPLNKPDNGFVDGVEYSYSANDTSAADLTGDGKYELIVMWEPDNAKDNSQAGKTGDVLIDAYTLAGEFLWRINLGQNIRAGAHYTQFIAYDFNQDGRAEVAMKTADGTVDGGGNVIGDAEADYRNDAGYILDGPEFLTMFDGLSGEAITTIDYIPPRGDDIGAIWGDDYGNRVDRFMGGVAYLNGQTPSLVMTRGHYTRTVIATFNFDGSNLTQNWVYDSDEDSSEHNIAGQGAHSLSIADVDGDGNDEIIFGAATLNNDGTPLYSTGLGHGDALHVADIIPDNPGLEVYMVHEESNSYITDEGNFGLAVRDAATGEILLSQPSSGPGDDVGRGVTADIDPNYPGMETWGSRGGLMAADGTIISDTPPSSMNFVVWWNGDLNRELLDGTRITKWDWEAQMEEREPLLDAGTFANGLAVSNNGTKATPALSADILGDWREEVVFANENSTRLMIYSTNIPTDIRLPTLMHDRQYRNAIAWQNVGYNQPPHPSFYMGSDMELYDHVIRELPQFRTQAVSGQPVTTAIAQGNNHNILVKVFPGEAEIGSFEVFRSDSSARGSATSVGTVDSGATSFVDESAMSDITYYYWVEATDTGGNAISGIDGPYRARMTSTQIPRVEAASSNNYVDLTWVTSLELSDIYIYRAETDEQGNVPSKPSSALTRVNPRAKTWTDETTQQGQKYYYWVELTTAQGNVVDAEPVFGENLIVPETNLDYSYADGVKTVCWNLENFPEVSYSELYRNDVNDAPGRTRIYTTSDPDVIVQGCFDDDGGEDGFAEGQGYWYMFKYRIAADGSEPTSEIVGPFTAQSNATNLNANLDAELGTINLTWSLRNFDDEIVSADLHRASNQSMSGSTRVRSDVRLTDGRLRDDGGNDGFTQGETYWYAFEVTLIDGTVINTDAEGGVLFELPEPETNLTTRLEDGGIRIDWNLQNFPDEITQIEILRNTDASSDGAMVVVSEGLEPRGVYAEYDGLVEDVTYWYMMRVTLANGDVITGEPLGEIVYQENPTSTSLLINVNEDGFCGFSDGSIDNNHPGHTGDGFVNTDHYVGVNIAYKVNIRDSGTYRIMLRYANGTDDNRWAQVNINNMSDVARLDLNGTGGWDQWMETQVDVELDAGETDIVFAAGIERGLGNVDSMTIDALSTDRSAQAIPCAN